MTDYSANLLLANLVIAVVLPNAVALVTAKVASSATKSILLLILAAIAGVVSQVVAASGTFHWKVAAISFAQIFIASVAAHYGLLKPTGVTGSDGIIQTSLPAGLASNGGVQPASNGSPL